MDYLLALATIQHDYPHLPPDVQSALAHYTADIADGVITFGDSGYADTYPGSDTDSIGQWVADHTHYGAITLRDQP